MAKRSDADLTRMIGNRIKELRLERGLTQEALAERLGLQPGTLSRMENGVVGASLATVGELSRVLGVPLSAILDGIGAPNQPGLSPEELTLVHFFREVPAEYRAQLTELVKVAARLPGRPA
jgi:transcriptional regulator with XRE-family HTH domain